MNNIIPFPSLLWIVYWSTKNTKGHGSPVTKTIAKMAVELGNEPNSSILYWMEKAND